MGNAPDHARFYMSVIAQGEILAGIEAAGNPKRQQALREWYQHTIKEVAEVLLVTSAVAEAYARIFDLLRRAGTPISTNDIWIAATAVVHNLTILTADQDFRKIPGIEVEDWSIL